MNLIYDKLHDFGDVDLTGANAVFPNILNLGETSADRMTIDVRATAEAAGGTSVTISIQTADTPTAATWKTLSTHAVTPLAEINGKVHRFAISPGASKCLRVGISKAGTFTAGTLNAQLNTYIGK